MLEGEDGRTLCEPCFRLQHTIWTFAGPMIRDIFEYIDAGEAAGFGKGRLLTWNMVEEDILMFDLAEFLRSSGSNAPSGTAPASVRGTPS